MTVWDLENGLLVAEWDRLELVFLIAPLPLAWILNEEGRFMWSVVVGSG